MELGRAATIVVYLRLYGSPKFGRSHKKAVGSSRRSPGTTRARTTSDLTLSCKSTFRSTYVSWVGRPLLKRAIAIRSTRHGHGQTPLTTPVVIMTRLRRRRRFRATGSRWLGSTFTAQKPLPINRPVLNHSLGGDPPTQLRDLLRAGRPPRPA